MRYGRGRRRSRDIASQPVIAEVLAVLPSLWLHVGFSLALVNASLRMVGASRRELGSLADGLLTGKRGKNQSVEKIDINDWAREGAGGQRGTEGDRPTGNCPEFSYLLSGTLLIELFGSSAAIVTMLRSTISSVAPSHLRLPQASGVLLRPYLTRISLEIRSYRELRSFVIHPRLGAPTKTDND